MRRNLLQGIKLSFSSTAGSSVSSLDSDILQLVWTIEELQQRLDVIDKQCERLRKSALTALKAGNRSIALRNMKRLKLASENGEKVGSFLNRVEGVLQVIMEVESTKKVAEAIQIVARVIKESQMSFEQVQSCLQELDEVMEEQEHVRKALESTSYDAEEDEDIEDELKKLELQIRDEDFLGSTPKFDIESVAGNTEKSPTTADLLSNAMQDLKLVDMAHDHGTPSSTTARDHSTTLELEAV